MPTLRDGRRLDSPEHTRARRIGFIRHGHGRRDSYTHRAAAPGLVTPRQVDSDDLDFAPAPDRRRW